ncbi:hypothetical protein HK097_011175 [Rhizophlyctis rosea]|uniref:Uncharacterized protein n=1 Tax=Rhizophlyctis rosea TaxID=64517 RepID=A0AAD5SK39_9FUNG|nr:hypothetical protein HK097_011175 [Rhizophlyctis rosea]
MSRGRSASDASTSLEVLVDLTAEDNGDTVRAIGGAASPMPIFPHDGAFSDLLTVQSPPEYGRPPFSPLPVARYPSFDSTTSLSYSEGVRSDWTEDAASHTGSFLETPPFTQSFDALGPPSPATGPLSPGMFPSYVADNTLMLNRFLAEMPHSLSLQTPPYEYDQTVVFRNSPMSPPLSDIFPLESPAIPVDGGTPGLSGYPPWSDPAPPPNAPPVPSIAISLYSPAETEQSDLISDFLDNPPPDFSALSESHPNSLGGLQVPDLTGMRSYDSYSDVSSCADASEIIEAMSAVGDSDYLEVGVQHVSSGLEVKSPLAGFDVRLNSVSLEGLDVGHHPTLGVQHQPGLRVPTGIGVHPTLEIHPGTTTLEELAASLQLDAPA